MSIASDARELYAWVDSGADAETRAAWRFPHHQVDGDGGVGAANIKACVSGIAILNGSRGTNPDSTPWGKDREGIFRHLAKHIKDSGADAPPLKSRDDLDAKTLTITLDDSDPTALGAALSYAEHVELVAALADRLVVESKAIETRAADRQAYRAKEGRTFSQRNAAALAEHAAALHDIGTSIEGMVNDYTSSDNRPAGDVIVEPKPNPKKDGIAAWAEAQRTLLRLDGLVTV